MSCSSELRPAHRRHHRDPAEALRSQDPSRGRPGGSSGEGGFALLVALVALVALTALATGGIWIADNDYQSARSFGEGQRAFYAADAALEEFLGTYGLRPPSSKAYDFGNGETATVSAVLLRRYPNVYKVEATGRVEVSGEVVATRTVGTMAEVDLGPFPQPNSSLFSPLGVMNRGGAGVISGYDQFDPQAPGQCPHGRVQDQNGIVVSDDPGYRGNPTIVSGSPNDILEQDRDRMLNGLDLDWQGVVEGRSVEPDLTVDPADMADWPDFDTVPATEWPVIYATGKEKTLTLSGNDDGHGLLMTRGDLSLSGTFVWKGMVVVGGRVVAGHGDQTLDGSLMSGLNLALGEDVRDADLLRGENDFQYHSCNVRMARSGTSSLVRVPGTWYQGAGRS